MSLIQTLYDKTPGFLRRGFASKEDFRAFLLCGLSGFVFSILTFRYLDGFPYEMGKNLVGVFIPPFVAIIYLTYTGYKYSLDRKLLYKTLLLYFFQPTPANDFARYYLNAKNMIDNNTLWGGDQLVYNKLGKGLVTQPGYRYFIFLELLVFRDLYRIVSFFNISLLITGVYCFQRVIHELAITDKFKKAILVLVVLITPVCY